MRPAGLLLLLLSLGPFVACTEHVDQMDDDTETPADDDTADDDNADDDAADDDVGDDDTVVPDWIDVCAGFHYSCGVRGDGTLACWGCDGKPEPECTPPPGTFTRVSCAEKHACAVTQDGKVRCWGSFYGTLADADGPWVHVDAGVYNHACALRDDGTLHCSGCDFGDWGQCDIPP